MQMIFFGARGSAAADDVGQREIDGLPRSGIDQFGKTACGDDFARGSASVRKRQGRVGDAIVGRQPVGPKPVGRGRPAKSRSILRGGPPVELDNM